MRFQSIYRCLQLRPSHTVLDTDRLCSSRKSFPSTRTSSQSTAPSPSETQATRPKRPSPYRLLERAAFLSASTNLHAAGWRIVPLNQASVDESGSQADESDFQDRKLVRAYDFTSGKDGWRDVLKFVNKAGEVIEAEDHHPTIHINHAIDYIAPVTRSTQSQPQEGFIVEISAHTHTPLPSLPAPKLEAGSQSGKDGTVRPGVTGKDLKLAERIEGIYADVLEKRSG